MHAFNWENNLSNLIVDVDYIAITPYIIEHRPEEVVELVYEMLWDLFLVVFGVIFGKAVEYLDDRKKKTPLAGKHFRKS